MSERVSAQEAAKEIGCAPQFLREMVRRGEWDLGICVKPRKAGGNYRCYVFRAKLDRFLGKAAVEAE